MFTISCTSVSAPPGQPPSINLNTTPTLLSLTWLPAPSSIPKPFLSPLLHLFPCSAPFPSCNPTFKSLHPASSSNPTPSLIPPGSASLWAMGYSAGGGAGICSAACCAWRSGRLSRVKSRQGSDELRVSSSASTARQK